MKEELIIKGARQNNLKNINLNIPKNKLVVITGVSGSGKSSLAFETIYAEGYRRYVENLSAQAKFFLHQVAKSQVDKIENLAPAIAIEQKRNLNNPRSTVGTLLGVYSLIRVLAAVFGEVFCPHCQIKLQRHDEGEIVKELALLPDETEIYILAAWSTGEKKQTLKSIKQRGYSKLWDGQEIKYIDEVLAGREKMPKKIKVLVDRLALFQKSFDRERIIDSLRVAAKLSKRPVEIVIKPGNSASTKTLYFSQHYFCPRCDFRGQALQAKNFSFNTPEGFCEHCQGLGEVKKIDPDKIIPNKKLSFQEGGLLPWNKLTGSKQAERRQEILRALARHYHFSLQKPIAQIPLATLEEILQGTEKGISLKLKSGEQVKFYGLAAELFKKSADQRGENDRFFSKEKCAQCQGLRLKPEFLAVNVFGESFGSLLTKEIGELYSFFQAVRRRESARRDRPELSELLGEINKHLKAVIEVGLSYLSLNRSVTTLSGGEFQRLRLATQLQSGLSNLIYVLDEPSIGLHGQDIRKLIRVFRQLQKRNNTLIVVEHDREIIKAADYVVDIGPGAGRYGGEVVFAGSVSKLRQQKTETAKFLFQPKTLRKKRSRATGRKKISLTGVVKHNLRQIDVDFPLEQMTVVTGVSGSGKSSLVIDVLAQALQAELNGKKNKPTGYRRLSGIGYLKKVVMVNQSPIGRSPRSNVATYTGVFNHIRRLFAQTEAAQKSKLTERFFSFNLKGGRCEYCQGEGVKKIDLDVLGSVYVRCEHCQGTRYSRKVLKIKYHGVNIAEVLEMSIDYAGDFFHSQPVLKHKLTVLKEVGLGYLKLGQNATQLSGGEAQRVKLATELIRQSTEKTLYILDEPTIGLHFSDIERLLTVLDKLIAKGNSVIIIEHNTDIIQRADWVIELGPGGGRQGGRIIFQGRPAELRKAKTPTAKLLS